MVKKFTLEEAKEYNDLNKELVDLERFISEKTYRKIAQDILQLNVLRNKEVLDSISGIILEDINKAVKGIKEKLGAIGKEYKS